LFLEVHALYCVYEDKQTQRKKETLTMSGLLQELLDAGGSQFGVEVLVRGIETGDISDSLDVAIGKTKLQKKVAIKDIKQYIADELLTQTVEEYQKAGICKAGTVGGDGAGRSKGPKMFMLNADKGHVYPNLYFKGGGVASDEQKAFRAEFKTLMEKYCKLEEAPVAEAPAKSSKKS